MNSKRLIDSPSPSAKPDTAFRGPRVLNSTPPPDYTEFKEARSSGLKAARAGLTKRLKRK
jgi:hypothetical protein